MAIQRSWDLAPVLLDHSGFIICRIVKRQRLFFYPLHIMDHSILQGRNKDSDLRKALNDVDEIKRRVQFYGGVLNVHWHNY